MRNECNIIRDILPLYMEDIASADTVSFVEEHLANCATCRTELESMKNPNSLEVVCEDISAALENDARPLKTFMKKWNRKKHIIMATFVIIFVSMLLFTSCFVSYLKFNTANVFSAVNGFMQIMFTDIEYVEIQESPKVILAQPDNTLLVEYMEERGFIELEEERLGALCVFSNGEDKELIIYSQNAYFSKWCWE